MIKVNCNICGKNLKGYKFNDKYTKVTIRKHSILKNPAIDDFYLCNKCAKRLIKNLKGVSNDMITAYEEEKTLNEIREEKGLRAAKQSESYQLIERALEPLTEEEKEYLKEKGNNE